MRAELELIGAKLLELEASLRTGGDRASGDLERVRALIASMQEGDAMIGELKQIEQGLIDLSGTLRTLANQAAALGDRARAAADALPPDSLKDLEARIRVLEQRA